MPASYPRWPEPTHETRRRPWRGLPLPAPPPLPGRRLPPACRRRLRRDQGEGLRPRSGPLPPPHSSDRRPAPPRAGPEPPSSGQPNPDLERAQGSAPGCAGTSAAGGCWTGRPAARPSRLAQSAAAHSHRRSGLSSGPEAGEGGPRASGTSKIPIGASLSRRGRRRFPPIAPCAKAASPAEMVAGSGQGHHQEAGQRLGPSQPARGHRGTAQADPRPGP